MELTRRSFFFIAAASIIGGLLWAAFVRILEKSHGRRFEWLH